MRGTKYLFITLFLLCMVVCLLAPRLCGAGCPATDATLEEILSEFDSSIPLGINSFSYPFPITFGNVAPANSVGPYLQPYLSGSPIAICDLPDTFRYFDLGANVTIPNDAELLARAELIARARLGDASAAMVLGDILWHSDFDRDGKPDKVVRDRYGYGKWVVLSSGGLDHNFDGKPDEYRVGPDGSTYLAEVKIEKAGLSEPAPGIESVVDHLQPFVLGGPTSQESEYEKAWKKMRDKGSKALDKHDKRREAEKRAKRAAEKLGKALNDTMDAEPGSEEAKKAGEKVGEAAKEAAETAKDADKAKDEYEEAAEEAEKAKNEWKEAFKKVEKAKNEAYEKAEKAATKE